MFSVFAVWFRKGLSYWLLQWVNLGWLPDAPLASRLFPLSKMGEKIGWESMRVEMKKGRWFTSYCHRQSRLDHGVSPWQLLSTPSSVLFPCSSLVSLTGNLSSDTQSFCSSLLMSPLGSQGCFSHFPFLPPPLLPGNVSVYWSVIRFWFLSWALTWEFCCWLGQVEVLNMVRGTLQISFGGSGGWLENRRRTCSWE